MTFAILKKIIEKHNIPEDVELLSDSGWECGATEMDGVWYNAKLNVIEFTQDGKYAYSNNGVMSYDEPHDRRNSNNPDDWVLLYYHDHWGDGGKTEI